MREGVKDAIVNRVRKDSPRRKHMRKSLKSVQNRSQQQEQGPQGAGTPGMMKQRGGEEHRSRTTLEAGVIPLALNCNKI